MNRRSSGQTLDDVSRTGIQKKHAKSVAKSSVSKNKTNPTIRCVCTSKEETGHMLECEICSKWLHSNCVNIKQSSASTYPFVCPHCVKQMFCQIKELTEEIKVLKSTIDDQAKEISSMKNEISSAQAHLDGNLEIATQLDNNQLPQPTADLPSATRKPQYQSSPVLRQNTKNSDNDRKFNIILFGVSESPPGTPRFRRTESDFKEVFSVLSNLENNSDRKSLVRDCHRIGRYNSSKNRPIRVNLGSTADVGRILSLRSSLSSPLVIKPDLSPSERVIERLLLSERWRLIQSGTDRRYIKLKNSCLYINGHLHGKIINGSYSQSLHSNDVAPQLSHLTLPVSSLSPKHQSASHSSITPTDTSN